MKRTENQAEALDAFIDVARPTRPAASGDARSIDAETASLVQDLYALAEATPLRADFADELEGRLLRQAAVPVAASVPADGVARRRPSTWRWPRGRGRSWPTRAAAVALVMLAIGTAIASSPAVWAQIQRLVCFVPGLGIRSCDGPGLIAPGPVSVSRDGATLTVTQLLSSGDETVVRVEISRLPTAPTLTPSQRPQLALRDERGKTYPPAPRPWSSTSGGATAPGAAQTFRAEPVFAGLDPEVRAVELLVDGSPPLGSWQVRVPVVPVEQVGLSTAQGGGGSATLHGITVRVASVVADRERTAIQLDATVAPPLRFVRNLGGFRSARALTLRDDRGGEHPALPGPQRTSPDRGDVHSEDLLFSPLAPETRSAELILPFVTVTEETAPVTLVVPIAGRQVGERIPLEVDLTLGPYPFRVTGAEVAEQRGQRRLILHLDLGDWHAGRKLVMPERVRLNGQEVGFQFGPIGDVGQVRQMTFALSEDPGEQATMTLWHAQVAVEGPWRLEVPARGGR